MKALAAWYRRNAKAIHAFALGVAGLVAIRLGVDPTVVAGLEAILGGPIVWTTANR